MNREAAPIVETTVRRVIGRVRGARRGPTLICVGGIHGNEPAGVRALERVFAEMDRRPPPLRGELVGLAGNLRALAEGRRFVASDLNRIWRPEVLDRLPLDEPHETQTPDEAELVELRRAIRDIVLARRGPVYFLDLHTTSSRSAPFAVINDTIFNRRFARNFPVPTILGFEEFVGGTVADYAHGIGCVTMGFEAGSHHDPRSIDLHEATIRVALTAAGLLTPTAEVERHRRRLGTARNGLPRYFEIRDRYPVTERRLFEMKPGYDNFQPVAAGEELARDSDVRIRARERARLFMPLYQDMGEDGFFLVRPVSPFWLGISTGVRRLRLGAVAHWLPGVQRHPELPNAVVVQPKVARWYVNEVFHLLGYRRRRREGRLLVFTRRLHDLGPPPVPAPEPAGRGHAAGRGERHANDRSR